MACRFLLFLYIFLRLFFSFILIIGCIELYNRLPLWCHFTAHSSCKIILSILFSLSYSWLLFFFVAFFKRYLGKWIFLLHRLKCMSNKKKDSKKKVECVKARAVGWWQQANWTIIFVSYERWLGVRSIK